MIANSNIWAGHKVRLRAPTANDLQAFFEDGQDTEAGRYGDQINLPDEPAALQKRLEEPRDSTSQNAWLVVEAIESGQVVGSANAHGADPRHRNFEYGIGIFRDARRFGYASEAIALLLRYYFLELGYHRATAVVYSFNNPSLALHHHLGFREEGCLREDLYTNGRYYDKHLFGMLANEAGPLFARLPAIDFGQSPGA